MFNSPVPAHIETTLMRERKADLCKHTEVIEGKAWERAIIQSGFYFLKNLFTTEMLAFGN